MSKPIEYEEAMVEVEGDFERESNRNDQQAPDEA